MKFITLLTGSVSIVTIISATVASAQTMDEIIEGARAEGMLTTIALPHDWCNYGGIIASFKEKYPFLTVNELNPDAGSADELEAVRANRGNTGPQAPDVLDDYFWFCQERVNPEMVVIGIGSERVRRLWAPWRRC